MIGNLIVDDTIVAISTALGKGAISIIKISGEKAVNVANKIFKGINLEKVPTHTIHYGHIYEGKQMIDEVLVSVMRKPKTYTTEDIVEINCHGGLVVTDKILKLVIKMGARLAEPGEFTKRAFVNGRIDLIKAEGVCDLINSKSEMARRLALKQISGNVSSLIKDLKQELLPILANIEVNIDYPEYEDVLVVTKDMIKSKLKKIKNQIRSILKASENSNLIKEGIKTLILGRPNVGKSSLLNRLLNEEKAIVTEIEGTTRDMVEGQILIAGVLFHIIDTAGIRTTKNIIEKIGVKKSLTLINEADLIILVLNNNEKLTREDLSLIKKTAHKVRIIFVNKTDLVNRLDKSQLKGNVIIEGNTISPAGLDELVKEIKRFFKLERLATDDFTYLSNARSISLLEDVQLLINDIEGGLNNEIPIDILAIDLNKIYEILGKIIGETYDNEIIDCLFSQFCIGK